MRDKFFIYLISLWPFVIQEWSYCPWSRRTVDECRCFQLRPHDEVPQCSAASYLSLLWLHCRWCSFGERIWKCSWKHYCMGRSFLSIEWIGRECKMFKLRRMGRICMSMSIFFRDNGSLPFMSSFYYRINKWIILDNLQRII